MKWIGNGLANIAAFALAGLRKREPIEPIKNEGRNETITPAYVEGLIDAVGRERVFDRARMLGWGGGDPPLWVWYQICCELLPSTPRPRHGSQLLN